eukprot:m.66054 g.66054  ORF g.66054 m.66054 type:complete len:60 (+) comp12091_c1_seq1:318-497(+)
MVLNGTCDDGGTTAIRTRNAAYVNEGCKLVCCLLHLSAKVCACSQECCNAEFQVFDLYF